MGVAEKRFSGLALLVATAAACGEGPPAGRVESTASSSAVTRPARATATVSASATPAAARPLCEAAANGSAPTGIIETVYAPDAKALPPRVHFGDGRFTWVTFWASWCKPCVAEIPRVLRFVESLRADGHALDVAFVAVDDERDDVAAFLEAQARDGLRATYWLPQELRRAWVQDLALPSTSALPAQSFVDPAGRVVCHAVRAVEEPDYPIVASLLGVKR